MEKGRDKIIEIVEKAYHVGTDHLVDKDLGDKMMGLNCCKSCLFIMVLIYITVHYIYLMIDKYAL